MNTDKKGAPQLVNPTGPTLSDEPRLEPPSTRRDDLAYLSPMAVFLALTWAGGHWPELYPASYVTKTVLAAGLLICFRRQYTRIRWDYWQLGILVGVIGIIQWVGMEKLLLHYWPNYPRPGADPFIASD